MNKGRRRELKLLHYKRRIKRFCYSIDIYEEKDGTWNRNPKAIEIIERREQLCYMNTSTPCSCFICQGEKYSRAKAKQEFLKLLKDELEQICPPLVTLKCY